MKTAIRNQIFNSFTLTAAKATCLNLPEHYADWAETTDWQFNFHGVSGTTPTSMVVKATFEQRIINWGTTSPQEEEFHDFGSPAKFAPVTFDSNPGLLPSGDWPAVLLDYPTTDSLAAPVYVSRRIAAGFRHRVRLSLTITGGDATTGLLLSATTVMRG